MRCLVAAIVLALVALTSSAAFAHPLQFGSLTLRERPDRTIDMAFRFSGTEDAPADARVVFPSDCHDIEPARESLDALGLFRIGHLQCDRTLEGREVRIDGLAARESQVLAAYRSRANSSAGAMIDPAHPHWRIDTSPASPRTGPRFLALGVEHIATGIDHLAFVAALFALSRTRRRIVATITAFTLGHSITLAAASLGLVRIAVAPIEACIALSLLLVAYEVAHPAHDTITRRNPWLVAALFGLVHGFGFASALGAAGISRVEVPRALLCFNLGVEAGQLAFVALLAIVALVAGRSRSFARIGTLPVAYGVGSLGAFLLLDRVVTMLR